MLFLKVFFKQLIPALNLIKILGIKYSMYSLLEESFFQIGSYTKSSKILRYKINLCSLKNKNIVISTKDSSARVMSVDNVNIKPNERLSETFKLSDIDLAKESNFVYVFDVYKYFLLYGDFHKAAWIRACICEWVTDCISQQKKISTNAILYACLDLQKTTLDLFLSNSQICGDFKAQYPKAHDFLTFLINKDYKSSVNTVHSNFQEYLSNKSIGIVGPGNSSSSLGKEIDNLNIVIRPNFSINTTFNHVTHGSRTNLSYYNHAAISKRPDDVESSSKYLEWLSFKEKSDISALKNIKNLTSIRVYELADDLFYFGSSMGLQNIVYDLLLNKAEDICLFSFDFYCSKSPYQSDYPSKETREYYKDNFLQAASSSLRLHDPFTNFNFIKLLYEHNRIDITDSVQMVLDFSLDNYAEELQELYGKFNLSST
jgi:hypothetical protein